MVTSLKESGYFVRGVDIKNHEYSESKADEFILYDLTDQSEFTTFLKLKPNHLMKYISLLRTWVVQALFLPEIMMLIS